MTKRIPENEILQLSYIMIMNFSLTAARWGFFLLILDSFTCPPYTIQHLFVCAWDLTHWDLAIRELSSLLISQRWGGSEIPSLYISRKRKNSIYFWISGKTVFSYFDIWCYDALCMRLHPDSITTPLAKLINCCIFCTSVRPEYRSDSCGVFGVTHIMEIRYIS